MAIKTFTTGEVLTASDTNTFLANSGLVFVTSGALATATTDFVGCFTSTYSNYRITMQGVGLSANDDIFFRLLSNTTPATGADYNWAMRGLTSAGGASDVNAAAQTLGYTGFRVDGVSNASIGAVVMDVFAPQLGQRTFWTVAATAFSTNFIGRNGMNVHNNTSVYDGIRFMTNTATTMQGTVTIYGYRKS
jgi:hypothetical protein